MRTINKNDFDDVYEIYMDEANNPYLLYEISDKKTFEPIFEKFMNNDAVYIYEQNNETIGMCACSYGTARTSHVVNLGTLAIKSQHHGKGYGTIFLNDVVEDLKQKGFRRIDLWVEADNPKAQKFYKKLGFQEDARIPQYYKRANSDEYIDEIIMSKTFN